MSQKIILPIIVLLFSLLLIAAIPDADLALDESINRISDFNGESGDLDVCVRILNNGVARPTASAADEAYTIQFAPFTATGMVANSDSLLLELNRTSISPFDSTQSDESCSDSFELSTSRYEGIVQVVNTINIDGAYTFSMVLRSDLSDERLVFEVQNAQAIQRLAGNGNTLLFGGNIITVDSNNSLAEALAFNRAGIIIAVGTLDEVVAVAGSDAVPVDLGGASVLPGFHDVHLHAVEAGLNENRCLLSEFASISDYRSEITACASQQLGSEWFLAAGVSMPDLLSQVARPIDLLDELVPNKPALILDNLGHGAWSNSQGLAIVGYDVLSNDPRGGLIDRDVNGNLSGVVYENAQQALRTAALPPNAANLEANYQALRRSLLTLASNGITSVSDAGGYWSRGHQQAWLRAEQDRSLSVRASNAYYLFPDKDLPQQVQDIIALRRNDPGQLVRFDQVKIYIDGIISQGTAALKSAYAVDPAVANAGPLGFEYFNQSELADALVQLDAAGFSLHFHATGDRGVDIALTAIENVLSANGDRGNRHRITHIFMVDEDDISRFAQLGVFADPQMAPSAISPSTISFYRSLLGDRADRIIPTASLINSGATVTLSSDWDADELSPFVKISAAVGRSFENVADVETALRLMTINSALLLGHADKTGSLEVGKFADLIVVDRNILQTPLSQISDTQVLATLLAGKAVFDSATLFNAGQ